MFTEETKKKLRTSLRVRILLVLISIILVLLMFPKGESLEFEVSIGSIWIQDDLIASTSFEVLKYPGVYKREIKNSQNNVNPIFILESSIESKQVDSNRSYSNF